MAVRSGKQLMGSGGHRPLVGMNIDEKELKQIINDLDKLLPHNRGTKTIVKQAMRKAMKPMLAKLKDLVPVKTKQLKKSLAIISGKARANIFPAVYVGPRVKNAYKSKDKSGFYMYFLEYGTAKIQGMRLFDKAKSATEQQVYNSIIPSLRSIIDRRFKKKGL